jgi:hypothetical protein
MQQCMIQGGIVFWLFLRILFALIIEIQSTLFLSEYHHHRHHHHHHVKHCLLSPFRINYILKDFRVSSPWGGYYLRPSGRSMYHQV